jgi:GxxExxY protein
MQYEAIPDAVENVARAVIGSAIDVHRALGPGFLERIYLVALSIELAARRIPFERECAVTVMYREVPISGQRIDLIVDRSVVVELKATSKIDPVHEAKVLSYLRTTNLRLGLILNFNAVTLREGIKRVVV